MSRPVGLPDPGAARTSELLERVAGRAGVQEIHAEELLLQLGDRGYGVLLLGLAVLGIIPNVPGFSGIVGLALMAITAQMILGRRAPWLPRFIRRKRLSVARLRRGTDIVARGLRRLERFCRPRLGLLVGSVAERVYGIVILYLALLIALPIPVVGNVPPAVAIITLAIGLLEKDGIVVLAGLGLSLAAVAVTLTAGVAAANALAATVAAWLG